MHVKLNILIMAVVAVFVLSIVGSAHADMVGMNYAIGGLNVTGTAGAVPQGNWNNESIVHNASSQSGGLATLKDDGNATVIGMSTSWTANAAYGTGASAGGTDTTLLYGGPESQDNVYGTFSISIAGIPYAEYDLYVYVKGWTAGRTGEARLNGVTGSEIGFDTYKDFPGSHSRATSTATQGTYVLWEGLTASSVTVDVRRQSSNVIISGFQVVEVPEPATMSLLALGGMALLKRRKRI